MKKIVILNGIFSLGGVETFFINTAKMLEKKGYEIHYVSLTSSIDLLEKHHIDPEKITIIWPTLSKTPSFSYVIRNMFVIKKHIPQNADYVFTGLYVPSLPVWILKFLGVLKPKLVFFIAMSLSILAKNHRRLWKLGFIERVHHGIIALTDNLKTEVLQLYPSRKTHVINIPINTERFIESDQHEARRKFNLPLDAKLVGLCGRCSPEKDFHFLVEAIAGIQDEDYMGVLVGNGPTLNAIKELSKTLNVDHRIFFLEPTTKINEFYPALDVYLQTTRGPSGGLSMLEAMSCKVPAVIIARDENEEAMARGTIKDERITYVTSTRSIELGQTIVSAVQAEPIPSEKSRRVILDYYSNDRFIEDLIAVLN